MRRKERREDAKDELLEDSKGEHRVDDDMAVTCRVSFGMGPADTLPHGYCPDAGISG